MTERPNPTEPPPYWTQSTSAARWQNQTATPLRRFIGGAPAVVLLRLVLLSFVVGALLMWLQISPADVFNELVGLVRRLYVLGFRSLQDFGSYIVAGAAIVIPVWLLMRLLSFRGR